MGVTSEIAISIVFGLCLIVIILGKSHGAMCDNGEKESD